MASQIAEIGDVPLKMEQVFHRHGAIIMNLFQDEMGEGYSLK